MDALKTEQQYIDAQLWLAEVLHYFEGGHLVMSPVMYQKYMDLIETTRQQLAEYERTLAQN